MYLASSPAAPVNFSRLDVAYSLSFHRTLTVTTRLAPVGQAQNFSPALLEELKALYDTLEMQSNQWSEGGRMQRIDYLVMRSAHPRYFSLGGDLAYFRQCIRDGNRKDLQAYSQRCADMVYTLSSRPGRDVTSIALVQGRALGGGFESALAADVIIAEEHAEFGFPEILFGLFPCTGGMSLLANRIGGYAAERMLTNGKIYSASELHALGVVDVVCGRGEGQVAVERFIATHAKQRIARQLVQRGRRRWCALDRTELQTVVEEWTTAALALDEAHLRVMDMLIRMQQAAVGG